MRWLGGWPASQKPSDANDDETQRAAEDDPKHGTERSDDREFIANLSPSS